MRVLVCGGRDFGGASLVWRALNRLDADSRIELVIEGGAKGADAAAAAWARENGRPLATYPACWSAYGRKAGPMRNEKMLVDARPDLVLAFPGGRGTADMLRRARQRGVRVEEVR